MAIHHDKFGRCGACVGVTQILPKFLITQGIISMLLVKFYSPLDPVFVQ